MRRLGILLDRGVQKASGMTLVNSTWASACAAALALLAAPAAAAETEGPPKSPPAAVRQFRDAVAFQDRAVYDLATDEWKKFLDKFPGDPLAPKAQHYLGVCQLLQKKYDAAIDSFRRVLREHPGSELADATYLNLGLAEYSLAQTGKPESYDQAAATLQTLVKKFPQSKELAQGLYYLGEALYARDKKAAAAKAYQQLVDKYPDSQHRPDALYALGVARQDLDQTKAAGAAFDRFLKDFPKHPLRSEVILRRAETLYALEDFAAAEKWFASAAAAKDFPLADLAVMRQAASLVEQNKLAEAAALYAALPQRFPDSTHRQAALLAAGNTFYQLGELDAAASAFEPAAAGNDPTAVEAARWLAQIHLRQQHPDKALAIAERTLPKAKDTQQAAPLMLVVADALYEIPARRKESIAAYAALAKQYPQHALAAQALYMAAFAALQQADYDAALAHAADFLQTHEQDPLAPDVRYIAAEAALQKKQYADAAQQFGALVDKYPAHADLATWQVRHALALYLDGKQADVVAALSPVVATIKPADLAAEAQYLLGSAQLELGQAPAAVAPLRASLAAEPQGKRADAALLSLADALRATDKLDEARSMLRKLTANFPASPLNERAYFRLGEYDAAAGDLPAAVKDYEHLLATWPASTLAPHALYALAAVQLSQNHPADATKSLSQLIDGHPQHELVAKARYARAVALQRQGDFAAAGADLSALLAANPPEAERLDALYLQGLCLAGLKQFDKAAAAFRAVLDADAKYAAADKVLYELAWALESSGQSADGPGNVWSPGPGTPGESVGRGELVSPGRRSLCRRRLCRRCRALRSRARQAPCRHARRESRPQTGLGALSTRQAGPRRRRVLAAAPGFPPGGTCRRRTVHAGRSAVRPAAIRSGLGRVRKVAPAAQRESAVPSLGPSARGPVLGPTTKVAREFDPAR